MAFIDASSCECTKSELDLFSVPPTQTSIENGTFVEYHPISAIAGSAPIEFDISASGEDYMDLANSYLFVKAKIQRADGANLANTDEVGPINNFLHSMFSQIDIQLNGTLVSSSTNTYPYRAYIENLLSYGPAAKESHLTAALFYKDEAGKMDHANPLADDANSGLKKRAGFTNRNRVVDLLGRLHSDIFFQPRYMLNDVNVKIRMTRSKDEFTLVWTGANPFRVSIVSAALFVRKVKLNPSVYLAHAKTLETGMAKYPIRRVVCKTFTIPAGYRDVSHEKLFSGQLPVRLVIGCVDNDAFNGSNVKNPFNFKHFSLTELALYLDGQQQGLKPIKASFGNNEFVRPYMTLFSGIGKDNRDEGNDIERNEYDRGYTLYAFDLTPDLGDSEHFNLAKQGSVRLDMKFGDALPNTVTVVAYAEFENVIEIDRSRNIVFDFSN